MSAEYSASKYSTGLTPIQTDTVTDPGGLTLSYQYDPLNGDRVVSQTNGDGNTTAYGYDTEGFQDRVVNPDGDITDYGHDVRGNLIVKQDCQNQTAGLCSTSRWTYYPDDTNANPPADPRNDELLTYRDARTGDNTSSTAYQTNYAYDSVGDQTGVTTPPVTGYPSGRTTTHAYTDGSTSAGGYQGAVPPKGLPYKETTPGGAVTTTQYDAVGDVVQVTDPDGQWTVYGYDGLGRKTSQTVYSDSYQGGLKTTYAYDANGDLATETNPAVTDAVTGAVHTAQTTTSYDPDGDVTSQEVADLTGGDASRTTIRTYNGFDQLASETDPAGAKTTYTYDGYGNKASQTDPDGNLTQYTYDGEGHLLTTTLENYTGSPPGSQAAAPLTVESRQYDPAGRLAYVTDAMGRVTAYNYTDNGLVSQEVQAPSSTDWSQSFTVDGLHLRRRGEPDRGLDEQLGDRHHLRRRRGRPGDAANDRPLRP